MIDPINAWLMHDSNTLKHCIYMREMSADGEQLSDSSSVTKSDLVSNLVTL